MCFPVNIAKFLRSPIKKNICQRQEFNQTFNPLISGLHKVVTPGPATEISQNSLGNTCVRISFLIKLQV